jgi:hypothetical protein
VILDSLDIGPERFAEATGWSIKPEGACRGEVCVPLDRTTGFDLASTAERLGMAIVDDQANDLVAVGPSSLGGRALTTAVAPELELDDIVTGETFALSSLRGTKVVLVAWAPY